MAVVEEVCLDGDNEQHLSSVWTQRPGSGLEQMGHIGEALDRREIGPNKYWDVRPLAASGKAGVQGNIRGQADEMCASP